jgi:hypothetical protein
LAASFWQTNGSAGRALAVFLGWDDEENDAG